MGKGDENSVWRSLFPCIKLLFPNLPGGTQWLLNQFKSQSLWIQTEEIMWAMMSLRMDRCQWPIFCTPLIMCVCVFTWADLQNSYVPLCVLPMSNAWAQHFLQEAGLEKDIHVCMHRGKSIKAEEFSVEQLISYQSIC